MRVMILCGGDFRGEAAMRVILGEFDMRKSISLLLLSDHTRGDRFAWKWAKELGVRFRWFRSNASSTTYKVAWMKRDVSMFEVGQPDVVIAFRGEVTKAGDRYHYVLELAKKNGVPVKRYVSAKAYSNKLKEVKDEGS